MAFLQKKGVIILLCKRLSSVVSLLCRGLPGQARFGALAERPKGRRARIAHLAPEAAGLDLRGCCPGGCEEATNCIRKPKAASTEA